LLTALDEALPADATVLDLGCGTGQAANFLAASGRTVIGADLTRESLESAAAAARRYGIASALFVETDLCQPGLREHAFDAVHCAGVLHHTADPAASFASAARLVKPGGVLLVGLYNAYARLPHRARQLIARMSGMRVVPFDPVMRERACEPARLEAWLRDQYQHPLEHRHTAAEVRRWFAPSGLSFLRCWPPAQLGADRAGDLFAEQDFWPPEAVLAQLGWAASLGGEGGLFFAIGWRPAA
jgi:2-polyprenyl-3-methyl-5-hydroxy-6-metoxy-1,4-benzoquinol methylase